MWLRREERGAGDRVTSGPHARRYAGPRLLAPVTVQPTQAGILWALTSSEERSRPSTPHMLRRSISGGPHRG